MKSITIKAHKPFRIPRKAKKQFNKIYQMSPLINKYKQAQVNLLYAELDRFFNNSQINEA